MHKDNSYDSHADRTVQQTTNYTAEPGWHKKNNSVLTDSKTDLTMSRSGLRGLYMGGVSRDFTNRTAMKPSLGEMDLSAAKRSMQRMTQNSFQVSVGGVDR